MPTLVTYQGYLTDEGGQPIDATVDLRLGLYDAASGGDPIWEETHTGVPVSAGYFSIMLGSVTPLGVADFSGPTRFLQVSVDTGNGW